MGVIGGEEWTSEHEAEEEVRVGGGTVQGTATAESQSPSFILKVMERSQGKQRQSKKCLPKLWILDCPPSGGPRANLSSPPGKALSSD